MADATPHLNGDTLRRTDTISSISITPEQFERLYLGPQNQVKGDLRKTFGNPTPVGLGGFLLAYTPLVVQFMGWRGSGGDGTATVGSLFFLGGLCAILACIGEFILGNSFPCVFFGVYGGFFLTYGATLVPSFGALNTEIFPKAKTLGPLAPEFLSSIAFLSLFTGLFTFINLIASLRTNVFFVIAFATLCPTFLLFAASRFYGAMGDMVMYSRLEFAAGAIGFAAACAGWYLLAAEILATVDFPVNLPVFDLSGYIPSATDLARRKKQYNSEMVNGNKE